MPGSYLIDLDRRIVFTRAWGLLSDKEIIAHAETLRTDSRFQPTFRQIGTFIETSSLLLTSAAIRSVAENNPFPRDARRSFVVTTEVAYGLARMFMLYLDADPKQFGIFREIGPALEWIGLDATTLWPAQKPDRIFIG